MSRDASHSSSLSHLQEEFWPVLHRSTQQQQQQQEGEKSKRKKSRGNRPLQRFRAKLKRQGCNAETISTMINERQNPVHLNVVNREPSAELRQQV